MPREKKLKAAVFLALILSASFCLYVLEGLKVRSGIAAVPAISKRPSDGAAGEKTVVTRVIDGDTIVIQGGKTVRLLGIDADEKNYPCYEAAKERLRELVLGKEVVLEASESDTDRYGRLLRYVFAASRNTSLELVKEGLVVSLLFPDNKKYREEIAAAESKARKDKTGCEWSGKLQIENH